MEDDSCPSASTSAPLFISVVCNTNTQLLGSFTCICPDSKLSLRKVPLSIKSLICSLSLLAVLPLDPDSLSETYELFARLLLPLWSWFCGGEDTIKPNAQIPGSNGTYYAKMTGFFVFFWCFELLPGCLHLWPVSSACTPHAMLTTGMMALLSILPWLLFFPPSTPELGATLRQRKVLSALFLGFHGGVSWLEATEAITDMTLRQRRFVLHGGKRA